MKSMAFILPCLAMLVSASTAWPQTDRAIISGYVYLHDSPDVRLPEVTVSALSASGQPVTAMTNINGEYTLTVESGAYLVTAAFGSFTSGRARVTVRPGTTSVLNLEARFPPAGILDYEHIDTATALKRAQAVAYVRVEREQPAALCEEPYVGHFMLSVLSVITGDVGRSVWFNAPSAGTCLLDGEPYQMRSVYAPGREFVAFLRLEGDEYWGEPMMFPVQDGRITKNGPDPIRAGMSVEQVAAALRALSAR
jgi:hypothetical protein